jgi:hypothetical protein
LRDVRFRYEDSEILDRSLTSTNFHTYYQGSEMVVAGKLPVLPMDEEGGSSSGAGAGGMDRMIEYMILATQAEGTQYLVQGSYNGSAVSYTIVGNAATRPYSNKLI